MNNQVGLLPLVRILGTGGTIAGRGANPLQTAGYTAGELSVEELTAAAPGLEQIARVEGEQICNVASSALTVDIWLTLARRINEIFHTEPEAAGIVVTHGTDTLEETAYFLNLVVKSNKPVVVVGAMRPATAVSPDGPMNLINAVRLASNKAAHGMGVLVTLNDEIYAARAVSKTHANQLHTFRSPEFGALGSIDNGQVSFYQRPLRKHTHETEFSVDQLPTLPRVDVVYSHLGADEVTVEALVAAGAQGLVLAGAGSGHTTPAMRDALIKVREQGVMIVRTTRTGSGRVLPPYDEALEQGAFVGGDNLNPLKARILLMLALTKTNEATQIQQMFNTH